MREKLKEKLGSRERFKGTFERYGLKAAYKGLPGETLLLVGVQTSSGAEVTDHLWLNLTKGFKELGALYSGDVVAFNARVRPYKKGYAEDWEIDYKLSHPTKVEALHRVPRELENYYITCPSCGHHNVAYLEPERCRRCGYVFEEASLVKSKEPMKLVQKTLL